MQKSIEERFKKMTDKLGMEIDPKILPTVITLNKAGVVTSQSCEGHLDHGLAGPWVTISVPSGSEEEKLQEESLDIYRKIEQVKLKNLNNYTNDEEYAALTAKFREVQTKILLGTKTVAEKLVALLDAFYKERIVPADVRLIVDALDSSVPRLCNQGIYLQDLRGEPKKGEKLNEYRKEFEEFTNFLMDRSNS